MIDCDRIPYDEPSIDDYTYVIDQSDPTFSIEVEPTYCGPYIYDVDNTSYNKGLVDCAWCLYLNNGLFAIDA